MTLSRRMALEIAGLTVSFVLLGAVLPWGLSALASQIDAATGEAAAARLRSSLTLLIWLCVGAVFLAILVNLSQYRAVVRPLRRLREGIHRLAGGNFHQPIRLSGDAEFSELAADLNRLAVELDSLSTNVEQRVLTRSRELVRSERLTSIGFLAAGVAHEINNPLNTITGYAELSLRQADRLPDPYVVADLRQALEVIREEGFRCKTITDKLLALAKSNQRDREPVSLAHIAEHAVAMLQEFPQFGDRRVWMSLPPDQHLMVRGSEEELKQVVLNLTVNALAAVPPAAGEVVLQGSTRNGGVELSVIDNGRGMTPEVLERAFEPFFSERRPDGGRGLGLGLSIAHAIVAAHGGYITAESDGPGHGSRFTVHLPACDDTHLGDEKAA